MGRAIDMDHAPLAARLADSLRAGGTPDHIADLVTRVPRHHFLPDVMWGQNGARYDRTTDPEAWMRAAYSDQALTTQHDDGTRGGRGIPTSSSSAPTVVARMLAAALLKPDEHVVEVGTGTGWNAALMCELLGDEQITTVEIDDGLRAQAQERLRTAGYLPRVETADAEAGLPPGHPWETLVATCTVSTVPTAWAARVRPGGRIVTPWSPTPGAPGGTLAVLDKDGDTLEGRFEGSLAFMWARGQRTAGGHPPSPDALPDRVEPSDTDPREAFLDGETSLLLSLLVPNWRHGMRMAEGATEPHVWIASTTCSSWARLHPEGRVEQAGPRWLADETTRALTGWEAWGRPGVDMFGLTVDPGEGLAIWLETPGKILWDRTTP